MAESAPGAGSEHDPLFDRLLDGNQPDREDAMRALHEHDLTPGQILEGLDNAANRSTLGPRVRNDELDRARSVIRRFYLGAME